MSFYNYLIFDRRPHREIFVEEQILEEIMKGIFSHSFVSKWTVDDLKNKEMPKMMVYNNLNIMDHYEKKIKSFERTKKWVVENKIELLI